MPRNFPKSIENVPLEDIRIGGMWLAADLVLKKRYNEAKRVLAKVLKLSPNDVEIMSLLAKVYITEGNLKKAQEWLNKVLLIDPNYPQALYHMGVVYHEKEEFERAIEMYEKAIEHFSEDEMGDIADAYQNLGCSLWGARRREEALEAWKTCLKYNPKQKYAKKNLKGFTNEYGMGKSPVGMDDLWAFVDFKRKEYLSAEGKDYFDNMDEAKAVMEKIMDAWNTKVAEKFGRKLDRMKTKEKIKLFTEIKVFT
jgi:tetratricopeptide (TPR) repeat protein